MKFEKISFDQYEKDKVSNFSEYDGIILPRRATRCSAGYDIFSLKDITLNPGDEVLLPTGIKIDLDPDKYLQIVPRSGLGFKHGIALANTVGIIDADYYNNTKNEGHIWVKLVYPKSHSESVHIKKGEAICQGIITPYYKVDNDEVNAERVGGFGSTTGGKND